MKQLGPGVLGDSRVTEKDSGGWEPHGEGGGIPLWVGDNGGVLVSSSWATWSARDSFVEGRQLWRSSVCTRECVYTVTRRSAAGSCGCTSGRSKLISRALAERIHARRRENHLTPLGEDEKLEIIMDWLGGASREDLQKRFKRGNKRIRVLIETYQAEALEVLRQKPKEIV